MCGRTEIETYYQIFKSETVTKVSSGDKVVQRPKQSLVIMYTSVGYSTYGFVSEIKIVLLSTFRDFFRQKRDDTYVRIYMASTKFCPCLQIPYKTILCLIIIVGVRYVGYILITLPWNLYVHYMLDSKFIN